MNPFHANYQITQGYGPVDDPNSPEPAYDGHPHFHRGLDLVGPSNTCPIYPTTPGIVFGCGLSHPDLANFVIIKDNLGFYHCYWHLSVITVRTNQAVTTDTQLGNQGMTGYATGYHLHYEVEQPGVWKGVLDMTPVNPDQYIQAGGSDMDTQEVVKGIYRILDPSYQPADTVIASQATRIETDGKIDGVLSDILLSKPWRNPADCNRFALEIYDRQRGGVDPSKFALDRVQGGDTFESVYFRDKAIDAATQQGKETVWIHEVNDLKTQLEACQNASNPITTIPNQPLPREATLPPITPLPLPQVSTPTKPVPAYLRFFQLLLRIFSRG